MDEPKLRREFLRFGAVAATALVWQDQLNAAECAQTEDNIEGPYYKAGAPERQSWFARRVSCRRSRAREQPAPTRREA